MNTEEFLDDLSDGRFMNEIDDNIRDTDYLMDELIHYAIDSYLGFYENKATAKAVQLDKITRGLHRIIAKLEQDKVQTLGEPMTLAEQYAENGVQQSDF